MYKLANILTATIREKQGVAGDVARLLGGSPIDPVHIQRYFGYLKGFGAVDKLVTIVAGGVPVNAVASGAEHERALQYENHNNVIENLSATWNKIEEYVRRQKRSGIQKPAAHRILNLRVSLLAAAVTHKVWIINDISFDVQSREKKWGLNGDTDPDTVRQCLCAEALPSF